MGDFNYPDPDLIKVHIDLGRPNQHLPLAPPRFSLSPHYKTFTPFGGPISSQTRYFGGTFFDQSRNLWRPTLYTRGSGEVIDPQYGLSLPSNTEQIIRAVGTMSSRLLRQFGFWVSSRVFVSTLDFHEWRRGVPTDVELMAYRDDGDEFPVETEISAQILGEYSPKVRLVEFDISNNVGIFLLGAQYPPMKHFVDPDWIVERDDLSTAVIGPGQIVACAG